MKSLNQYIVESLTKEQEDFLRNLADKYDDIISVFTDERDKNEIDDIIDVLQTSVEDASITSALNAKGLYQKYIRQMFYSLDGGTIINKEIDGKVIKKEGSNHRVFNAILNSGKPHTLNDFIDSDGNIKNFIKSLDETLADKDINFFITSIFNLTKSLGGKSARGIGKGEYLLRLILSDSCESKVGNADLYITGQNKGYEIKSAVDGGKFSLSYGVIKDKLDNDDAIKAKLEKIYINKMSYINGIFVFKSSSDVIFFPNKTPFAKFIEYFNVGYGGSRIYLSFK